MALEYKNRNGDVYYLQAGRTRTGKPKYYLGRQLTGEPLDAVPEGFEIYESPERGRVPFPRPRHEGAGHDVGVGGRGRVGVHPSS